MPKRPPLLIRRRAVAFSAWWAVLMALWLVLDDSVAIDELIAGACASAIAALAAELAIHQAQARLRLRARWLGPALGLPWQLVRDTAVIFRALWRRLAHGVEPSSGFRELPVRFGPDTAEGRTRRTLLIGGMSVAPNRFVLGLDPESDVMVVHELVGSHREASQ